MVNHDTRRKSFAVRTFGGSNMRRDSATIGTN